MGYRAGRVRRLRPLAHQPAEPARGGRRGDPPGVVGRRRSTSPAAASRTATSPCSRCRATCRACWWAAWPKRRSSASPASPTGSCRPRTPTRPPTSTPCAAIAATSPRRRSTPASGRSSPTTRNGSGRRSATTPLYQLNEYVTWGAFGPPDQVPTFPDRDAIVAGGAYQVWDPGHRDPRADRAAQPARRRSATCTSGRSSPGSRSTAAAPASSCSPRRSSPRSARRSNGGGAASVPDSPDRPDQRRQHHEIRHVLRARESRRRPSPGLQGDARPDRVRRGARIRLGLARRAPRIGLRQHAVARRGRLGDRRASPSDCGSASPSASCRSPTRCASPRTTRWST